MFVVILRISHRKKKPSGISLQLLISITLSKKTKLKSI